MNGQSITIITDTDMDINSFNFRKIFTDSSLSVDLEATQLIRDANQVFLNGVCVKNRFDTPDPFNPSMMYPGARWCVSDITYSGGLGMSVWFQHVPHCAGFSTAINRFFEITSILMSDGKVARLDGWFHREQKDKANFQDFGPFYTWKGDDLKDVEIVQFNPII